MVMSINGNLTLGDATPTNISCARTNQEQRFLRGFLDGYVGIHYNDGIYPAHRFQVCIPTPDPYRTGFLDGQALRLEEDLMA